ncbi:hypothetical protein GCK32_008123 [Trichostrongylus colubriformis]|uniref:Uncharacterized protein n=1 Tax=Trichostrongylus colubriformis TaxID=6319 RepID=A0AAN8IC58_TRICO
MTNLSNADTRTTFPTFESQAFANWICSHLPKVASFRVENVEILDSYNCLHRAVSKSESVMKNRLPGIQKESSPLEFRRAASDANDFVKACAAFAESCELRRDYVIELLNVGMIQDAAANSQLGLFSTLKCGVLFRIQQFLNISTLIRSCVVQPDYKNDLRTCLEMMRTLYSNGSSFSKNIFGCPRKKSSEVSFSDELTTEIPSSLPRTSTPNRPPTRPGHKTVASTILESFEELRLEWVYNYVKSSEACYHSVSQFHLS